MYFPPLDTHCVQFVFPSVKAVLEVFLCTALSSSADFRFTFTTVFKRVPFLADLIFGKNVEVTRF